MALHLHLHFQQRDMKLIKTFCNSEYVSTSRKCSTIFVFITNITTLNIAVIMVIITIKIAFIIFVIPVYIAVINLVYITIIIVITVNLSEMGEQMSVVGCSQRSRASGSFSSVKLLITKKKQLVQIYIGLKIRFFCQKLIQFENQEKLDQVHLACRTQFGDL